MTQLSKNMIQIDGSAGEGGGQILRSSLALSMMTGQPFEISNIRAKRAKPGLMRQHLTAVNAATQIASATITGAALKSTSLEFTPNTVRGGQYEFAIGSAGSALLILQTVLLPLCFAKESSEVVISGGTHNPFAPPFDFIERVFLPVLRKMGAQVELRLEQHGFFPAGGGRIVAEIQPIERLQPIDLLQRGMAYSRSARAIVNRVPWTVGEREMIVARKRLDLDEHSAQVISQKTAAGAGNIVFVELDFENITEQFSAIGQQGMPAEKVALRACNEAERYLKTDAPVGDYLADQLLLPFALAGEGRFRCVALSQHFKTNAEVIQQFLNIQIKSEREDRLAWMIHFKK